MSYTQLSFDRLIKVASEFVGLGDPIPSEIVAHLGPDVIRLIENPGANDEQHQKSCGLDQSSPKGETAGSS